MFKVVAINLMGFAKFIGMNFKAREDAVAFGKQYEKGNEDIDSWQVVPQKSTDYLNTAAKKWVKI